MTWNPNHAPALNDTQVKIYSSPYSPNASKQAINSSKINNSFAYNTYDPTDFLKRSSPQSVPIVDKSQSLRYQIDSHTLTNYIPGNHLSTTEQHKREATDVKEQYTASLSINSSDDFRDQVRLAHQLEDKVLKSMIANASTTTQHKVFGTEIPSWYITAIIFYTLLEQEYANMYQKTDATAFMTPSSVCDVIYDAYINSVKEGFDQSSLKTNFKSYLDDPTDSNLIAYTSVTKCIDIHVQQCVRC